MSLTEPTSLHDGPGCHTALLDLDGFPLLTVNVTQGSSWFGETGQATVCRTGHPSLLLSVHRLTVLSLSPQGGTTSDSEAKQSRAEQASLEQAHNDHVGRPSIAVGLWPRDYVQQD